MRVGIGRLKGDRGFQRLERAGEVLHHPARDTEMILRIEQTRIQRHGVLESRERLLGIALRDHARIPGDRGPRPYVRVDHERQLGISLAAAAEILPLLEHESEKIVGRGE